jgi:pimeloyl-ACP methyl ester carboxylesterase
MGWLRNAAVVGVFVLPLVVAASAARREAHTDFRPMRTIPSPPAILADAQLEDVVIDVRGLPLRGWFIPSSNGAAVLFAHGTGADRTQLAPEAQLLARHGYGALLFDWPGHGESGGMVTWDAHERAGLTAALDFVSRARGVDRERVGLFAFSMGGMIAIQVAARDTRVAALVVEGAFADADDQLRHAFRSWSVLSQWPALLTARWLGMKPDDMRPKDMIADIAPRPVFLIAGSADDLVPPQQTHALFEAARGPKSWWLVTGATHGQYGAAAGTAYEERLVMFFDEALLHKRRTASLSRKR